MAGCTATVLPPSVTPKGLLAGLAWAFASARRGAHQQVNRRAEMSMTQQQRDGGALFKNDRRESETSPDYKGTLTVAGVEYWLAGWIKSAKSGQRYMSLSVKPKNGDQAAAKPRDAALDDALDF
jgi:hypothetical protein